ncbi:MAG: hypothetical protein ABI949_12685 [Ilumatobacteraceae bacterium]
MARGRWMIAHQGGWDEILLVLGPIAVIIGLLMLARKRVGAAEAAEQKPANDGAATGTKPASPNIEP